MDHKVIFFISFVFCLTLWCQGLELSLDLDFPAMTGSRNFCGVLVCSETITSLPLDNDTMASSVSYTSILSMTLFKKAQTDLRAVSTNRHDLEVASVTTQGPSFTRVANGMKIVGSLDSTGATMRIELIKMEDCEAEFSCQVRGMDNLGREAVSDVSLVQQSCDRGKLEDQRGDRLSPSASLQLLTSIQQLMMQSTTRLENQMREMNKEIRGQMDDFERRIENKLDLFENRVEDKVDNNNNLNKLIKLDTKVSNALEDFRAQARQDFHVGLSKLTKETQQAQRDALKIVCENVGATLNKTLGLVSTMKNDFDLLKSYTHINLLTIKNETARIEDELKSQENVCRLLRNETIGFKKEVMISFEELQSTKENLSANSKNQLRDSFSDLEQTMSKEIKALTELILPSSCRIGMFPITTVRNFYPMTYSKHGLNFEFLCDTVTDHGGWILIQRRLHGDVDFDKSWADYKQGFGSVHGDFWLGNDNIHTITSDGAYELRVELMYKGKTAFAHYDTFSIGNENDKYKLTIGNYDGTAGDSLAYHNGAYFSTADVDNDKDGSYNCAVKNGGGWWFKSCDKSNLNGLWGVHNDYGVEWTAFTGPDSASYTEMKIRQI